jgi:Na+/proline symporter
MRYSHYAALFWGTVCVVLAFFVGDIAKTVIEAINKVGSVFYGPILATFIAAILIKRVNAFGANVGLLTGVLVNVYLWLFVPAVFWFWWNAIGAVVTLSVGIVVSLFTGAAKSDADTLVTRDSIEFRWKETLILVGFFVFMVLISMNLSEII